MTPKIQIDIDPSSSNFILNGAINELLSIRAAKIYLVEFLKANFASANYIEIPYEVEEQETVLHKVRQLLGRFDFEENLTVSVNTILEDYFGEEQNFKDFSIQAFLIRNNQLSGDHIRQFADFTAHLTSYLPSRVLYDLQLLSAYHLTFSQNACNFSVPGSGKTTIVYSAYAYLKSLAENHPKHINKLMIIGPLSSFGPWEDEYRECFGKEPGSKRLSGGVTRKQRVAHFYSSNPAEISLISYNSVPNFQEDIIFFLKKHKVMVVLDEAHKIKNITGGIIAEAVLQLAKYCKARIVLTGTPAPNGYEDIYNLFKFIWPTKNIVPFHLFQLKEMSENYADPRVKTLIDGVSPYFIRIRKSDLHIPEPISHPPTFIEMGDIQREIYEYIEKNYMDFFATASRSESLKTLLAQARVIRLMQASTNPALLKKPITDYFEDVVVNENFIDDSSILNKIMSYDTSETPPKFIAAGKLINRLLEKGEKTIVWAVFIQNILEFRNYLLSIGIASKILYGATPVEKDEQSIEIETREKIIREFHVPNSRFKVLIANPHAVSESISLHKACHNAIYLERSFNAAHFIQSKDRIHRYGLKPDDKIHYHYILSRNNIDFTIHQRLIEKEERMMRIIESESIPLFRRIDAEDNDDIKALIINYVNRTA
ncbi:MAG: DEAD/DEAH box helicase [Nanoarchaeota archaeon]|nr:DEAD/DEAH box helicase [Nanoarchaeota archaeon]